MGEAPDDVRASHPLNQESRDQNTPATEDLAEANAAEIQASIEQTRADAGETIDAIQARLDPDRLKAEATAKVREAAADRAHAVADQLRERAEAVADRARGTAAETTQQVRERVGGFRMPKLSFAEHPLHPQLIGLPATLLPFSTVLDLMHMATGDERYAHAAYYSMVGGFFGALPAAAAGAADYLTIPSHSPVKRFANVHAGLNVGLVALTGANLALRRGKNPPTGVVPCLLSIVSTVGLAVSAWFGQHMVYDEGMRVRGASPVATAPEMELPGGAPMAEALTKLGEAAPDTGPVLQGAASGR